MLRHSSASKAWSARRFAPCTDLTTKPWMMEAGVDVLDAPFVTHVNVATAGGCLASQYLAIWVMARLGTIKDARKVMHYVAPVGEKEAYVERALAVVTPFIASGETLAA